MGRAFPVTNVYSRVLREPEGYRLTSRVITSLFGLCGHRRGGSYVSSEAESYLQPALHNTWVSVNAPHVNEINMKAYA